MKADIRNRRRRLNNMYKIIDKEQRSVVFKMNKAQELIYDMEKQHRMFIILKARQVWGTTYEWIEWLDRSMFLKNQTIIITAHDKEKQKEIFQRVKYCYQQIPQSIDCWEFIRNKPKTKYDNANEMYFPDRNNTIKVSLDSRSWTPSKLHITELSFRRDAEPMMTGTLPSLPKSCPCTIETTANGIGNYFYNLWMKNYWTNGENNGKWQFYCLFIPRYTDDDYRTPLEDWEEIVLPEIIKHIEKLDIDEEQKKRYLNKYEELSVKREDRVLQEFPSTPEEAFLGTGNPVFNQSIVKWLDSVSYYEDDIFSDLRIYREPEDNESYNMGVDTSEWGANWDYSSIIVRDKNLRLMACYYWHIPADELCKVIDRLYELWYISPNKLWIERNNTGIATLTKAKDYTRYNDIYTEKTVDKKTNKRTKKLWRHTNLKTRPLMISEYEEAIRTGILTEIDERVRSELYTFVYNEKNKAEAQQWCHDDWIIGDCISLQMTKNIWYIEIQ